MDSNIIIMFIGVCKHINYKYYFITLSYYIL